MVWFYTCFFFVFFPITKSFGVSMVTMHICCNSFSPLLSRLWPGNGLLKLFTHQRSTDIPFCSHLLLFVLCFFFLSLQSTTLLFLWLNVACKLSSKMLTLYYLMITVYDIQEQYFTLLLCKVYLLCLLLCFFSHEHLSGNFS